MNSQVWKKNIKVVHKKITKTMHLKFSINIKSIQELNKIDSLIYGLSLQYLFD